MQQGQRNLQPVPISADREPAARIMCLIALLASVAVIACLLLIQIADGERFPTERRLIYGIAGGLILGEITWGLNYWPLTGWTGGAVLLIAFYFVAGLLLAQVREGVRRRDLLEYGLSAAIMFAIVAWAIR